MWWCSLRRGEGGLGWIGLDWVGLDWVGLDWIRLDGLDWDGIRWDGGGWGGMEKKWMKLWSYDYGFCGAVKRCLKMA